MTSCLVPLDTARFREALALVGDDARPRELLARADAGSREAIAVGAVDEDGSLCGVAIHGEVAGASGTSALLYLAVRPDARRFGVGRTLVEHVVGEARARGDRLLVAELPASVESTAALGLLAACGFRREGEVADFYRDGVPLLLLGCRLE